MIVDLVVDADGFYPWMRRLADELAMTHDVRVRRSGGGEPLPSVVATLLALEDIVYRRQTRRHRRLPAEGLTNGDAEIADVALLLGRERTVSPARLVLRPRFAGGLGDLAIFDALLAGVSPPIVIEDVAGGVALSSGTASLETADCLLAGLDSIGSRTALLLEQAIRRPAPPSRAAASLRAADAIGPARAAKSLARGLASRSARALYRLCCHAPHWRIGWRLTDEDVWSRRDLGGTRWTALPDPGHRFYADPFAIVWQGRHFLFFEDLDHRTGKGIISFAEIVDGVPGPVTPVLEEAWHLSYPFLFERNGEIFMIPESSACRDVAVYRAVEFPHRWERHAQLLSGVEAADATLVEHGDRWWMFAVTRPNTGGYSDTLSIWHAPDPFGPWQAHAGNPLLIDPATARPAGQFVRIGGQLMRPVQDCTDGYGAALGLACVDRLDVEGFSQTVETILRPGTHWPGRKLHTLNKAARLEVIDGCILRPKVRSMATLADRFYRPD
ncbi:glucosamine inositolphosphorylceramide transferase family protein [Aureimonas pseudogalii]|uniref:Glucosamine inositolphosphorylceramide transferase 1 N-terminal domain-containing protein n=1 Tax=Aureimonas pseudogalii TaxID=1744844 RepID=A0A7W6MK36_9HYPH|nr:hypothetical protein [Aureimonas pseudogalii]MBB3998788.1 hypothetical protein [Aureimonas pseudogalii]